MLLSKEKSNLVQCQWTYCALAKETWFGNFNSQREQMKQAQKRGLLPLPQ